MTVVGVDACRGGWVAVAPGAPPVVRRTFVEILAAFPEAAVVGVDIPIGLPADRPRAADLEARAFVGPRRSSVFLTYPREVLGAPTYPEALALTRDLGWPGISKQSWGLRHRIFEVEAVLEPRVIEVHPEVSFRELAGAALPSKHTREGVSRRQQLLGLPGSGHDLLDAAVVAWSAERYRRGDARPLPERPKARRSVIWR